MLQIDNVREIAGVTIYGDHEHINLFYPMAQQPRYRLDALGRPSFSYFKYRFPVDHEDGKKGGGFVLFDVEFVVDEKLMPAVMEGLGNEVTETANRLGMSPVPEVRIGTITYTKGSTSLHFAEGLVARPVPNGAPPSLFGNNVCTFALELPPEGATFFEQAMQGQGGAVAVVYDLWFWARLPEVHISAGFNASAFYSFYQTIDTEWSLWGEDEYRETVREQMIQSEALYFKPEWGGLTDEKIKGQLRDWAMRTVDDAVERKMIKAVAPVPDDQRKLPNGIEDVTRDISNTQISSFSLDFTESETVEWHSAPQGILANITTLKDANGAPIKWSDYARVIDLDDPFYKTLRVNTLVNADFTGLPIHSVEVKLSYKGRPMANLVAGDPDGEVVLNSEDDIGKFAAFVENDDWKYTYSYQVNYRGESRHFQSEEVVTDEGNLTLGVDDVGILAIDAAAGDINWAEVDRAAVRLTYEDVDGGVDPIEEQFALTLAAPTYQIQHVMFQPMRKAYRYQVTFYMKGGKEYRGPELASRSRRLFVNDVFSNRKTVAVRGVGDFAGRIQTVFVDLTYADQPNDYELSKSQALSAASPFFDWTFPVIDENAGKVTYSATTSYKDGTSEQVPARVATTTTLLLPPPVEAFLEVQIVTDLITWDTVRLARVSLRYSDPEHAISQSKDVILSATNKLGTTWRIELKDKTKNQFTYSVTYYLTSGMQKTVGPVTTRDLALILDPTQ